MAESLAPLTSTLERKNLPMALYTIAFREKNFTAQVELTDVEALDRVARQSGWFAEVVVPELRALDLSDTELVFQCFPLDGLVSTWAGFFGCRGKYMSFALVKVADV